MSLPSIERQALAQRLKEETAAAHSQAESVLLPVLQSLKSRAEYANVLKSFYGFFSPLETRIREHISEIQLADIHQRRSARLALADLQNLGVAGEPEISTNLPLLSNVAESFGALYVLEGSTLGGKMIARMLKTNGHLTVDDTQLHFFGGYKDQTGPMWTRFLQALNQQLDADGVIDGARRTFTEMSRWMAKTLTHETR